MSRRIWVKVSPTGDIIVEASGFKGKGCEAATQAIEQALGKRREFTRKPDYWRQAVRQKNPQTLGGGDS